MSAQRKRRVIEDSDDEQFSTPRGSPQQPKRGRYSRDTGDENGHGLGDDQDVTSHAELEQGLSQGLSASSQTPGRFGDYSNYIPGSVVRVKISNFMTYDYVEFFPGPRLNMILGPNGTGKSSIAAAIAIGLGFPPKIMGRSPDLKSYVKQDAETATIEIELKGAKKRNSVIWRQFSRDTDKSTFKLNGEPVSRKAISDLVAAFGVQANNLCSFLPQDKVSDFAKMNPVTVLKETMRAAGDSRLSQWHEELVEFGRDASTVEIALGTETRKRDNVKRQVDGLAPEVRQFEARQEIEKELELATCTVIATQWQIASIAVHKAKADLKKFNLECNQEKAQIAPLLQLQAQQEMKLEKSKDKVKHFSKLVEGNSTEMIKASKAVDDAEVAGRKPENELKVLHDKVKQQQKRRRDLEAKIKEQEEIVDQPEKDKRDVHDRLDSQKQFSQDMTNNLRLVEKERDSSQQKTRELQQEVNIINNDINLRSKKLSELSNVELQKRQAAYRLDGSIQYAIQYIEANPDKFQSKVLFPPMISVNVANRDYAWQVEMCTTLNQRKTFITQNQQDYRTLMNLNGKLMSNNKKCALHLSQIEVTQESVNPPRPCTPEHLAELGFDGYAIDFVDAEAPVIAFLCQTANLHRSAVTMKPGDAINGERVAKAGIHTWATRTDFIRASRSVYGKRDFQFTASPPARARAFIHAVDVDAIKTLENEIAKFKRDLKDLEHPMEQSKQFFNRMVTKADTITKELRAMAKKIDDLKKEVSKQQDAHRHLERLRRQLTDHLALPSPEARRESLNKALVKATKQRVAAVQRYQDACTTAIQDNDSMAKHAFTTSQLSANCVKIREVVAEKEGLVTILSKEVERALHRRVEAQKAKQIYREKVFAELGKLEPGVSEVVLARSKTIDITEAERAVADLEARLEMSMQADPSVVERYKRLKKELEALNGSVEAQDARFQALNADITKCLGKFNPALNELVQETSDKFSAAFQKIGCTGEVRINREGSYAEWGIEILVSYRDNEQMEVLTASRQSGGERSLATVTYLMSLAKMSRTPFSLVDEINQGMDQRAERNVHNQMVEVTCSNATGQYFLITPKLLTGLDYHPNMRILVVKNGTWIPDTEDKKQTWKISDCLQKYRAAHSSIMA